MSGINIDSTLSQLLTMIITAIIGWFIGRRKNNAEASLLEIKGISAIKDFYESALKDTTSQLQHYITVTEENRKEIEANKKELDEMKELIKLLVDNSCTVLNCKLRKPMHTRHIAEKFNIKYLKHEDINNSKEKMESKNS